MSTYPLIEGWTDPIDCILLGDGVAIPLAGVTVEVQAYKSRGEALTLGGTASVVDAAAGHVRFTPAAGDLVEANSPMQVRWKLTSGSAIRYVPNSAQPDEWIVSQP